MKRVFFMRSIGILFWGFIFFSFGNGSTFLNWTLGAAFGLILSYYSRNLEVSVRRKLSNSHRPASNTKKSFSSKNKDGVTSGTFTSAAMGTVAGAAYGVFNADLTDSSVSTGSSIFNSDLTGSSIFNSDSSYIEGFDLGGVNPANGLPMMGGVDIDGNTYGTSSMSDSFGSSDF